MSNHASGLFHGGLRRKCAINLGISGRDIGDDPSLGGTRLLACVSFHDTWALMILSFKDGLTEAAFEGQARKGFPADLLKVARRKLQMIAAARTLDDLRLPPGNRLEVLTADRKGQHAIRVNDQFRICFVWTEQGARDVEFTDYH